MRRTFPAFMPQLFDHEGGYVDHPRDPGGATNLGITLATLREWRGQPVSKDDVRALTKEEATRIYEERYWNRIEGDRLLAGPDAMLFDVAVNSGVGRARQWMPLTQGKDAAAGVKAIGARRRAFFQSLKTFSTFGRGWMRRVNKVEAWSLAWALRWQGKPVAPVLEKEAAQSKRNSQATGGGAVATGGVVIAAPPAGAASGIDWITLAAVGVPLALLFAFLIYQALMQGERAKAMKEAAHV
ncbi:MAG: glycoside hydrolase family 108 protein [Methylobacterium sp.]|nr:glycoside hydrolase family 108 protein [Methylobacterium sp.]MCA3675499.1 glycoside hydrolase family 108 protein [Methylobacterium sp.]